MDDAMLEAVGVQLKMFHVKHQRLTPARVADPNLASARINVSRET